MPDINLYSNRVHPRRMFPISSWIEGISDYNKVGGSFLFARGVDYRTEPSQITLLPQSVLEVGQSTILDTVKWGEQVVGRTVTLGNSTNLIANGSFETNTTGWTLGTGFTRDNTNAYLGSYSIKQSSVGGTNKLTTASGSGIAVSQYTDYQLVFYTNVVISSGVAAFLQVLGASLSGANLLNTNLTLSDTGGNWTQVTVSFNSGANTSVFIVISNNGGTLTAYYDNFSLVQINSLATFGLGNAGNIYKRYSNAVWVNLHNVPNSHGNGLGYYGEDDFLYYVADKTLGRYGPISSGVPTFVDDFMTAQGGVPTNTNSLALVAASSQYAVKTSPASALKIAGDLAVEAFVKPSSLPAVGSSMTIASLWTETGNQRAWKVDILGISAIFGDGSNGSLTISVNTTDSPIDSQCSGVISTNQLSATNVSFAVGQKILILQMQGTGAGTKQVTTIQGYTAGVITTQDLLNLSYNSTGSNRAQVIVLKQYTNVTINTGVTWTAKAWNGTTGGILAFLANGTLTVTGNISANSVGFVGGTGVASGDAHSGEGTGGASSVTINANGNGGGGGWDGNIHAGSFPFGGGGGGGGGNATNGTTGATAANGVGGTGGNSSGANDLTTMTLGGGGGAGGSYNNSSVGGAGGRGAGMIYITAATITVTGAVTANASNGSQGDNAGDDGGGGGGAGGSILLRSQTATLGSGLITANAGSGAAGLNSGGAGGTGSVGRVHLDYLTSFSGTTSPTLNSTQDNTLVTTPTYQLRLGISNDGTSFEYLTQNLVSLAVAAWDRLQVSWDSAHSTAYFYEGGTLIGSATGTKTAIFSTTTADFAIGSNKVSAYQNFFDGLFNDVRVWNTQRTQDQFVANNLVNLNGSASGLVGNWFVTNTGNDLTTNADNVVLTGSPVYSVDVPYAGSTTRLDIDQSGGGTANTYTLPATLTENQFKNFVPAQDPQKSLQVNIGARGTGDWTLVVHDGLNRVVASVTVVNASLPSSGTYEFMYPSTFSPVIGATYHFHLYSTVADGTVKTTTVSDLTTVSFVTYYQFLINDTEYHPVMQMGNSLAIGNGRYLAVLNAAGGDGQPGFNSAGFKATRLRFPAGWRVRCLAKWRGFYAIGCWKGTAIKDFDQGIVFLWDGFSVTYNDFFDVPEGGVNAMYGENGTLYISAGYKGDILEYTGADSAVKVKRIPRVGKAQYIEVAPGGMTYWQGLLRIAVSYNSDSTTLERGVYTWGSLNTAYKKSLSFDYPISTGNRGSTVSLGALIPVGGNLLVGWQDNTAHGVDSVNISNPPQTTGTIEELISDFGIYWKDKQALTVRADHFPLLTGENVDVKYKTNYEANWHNLGISSQLVGDTKTRLPLPEPTAQYHSIQIAIDLYAANGTSPTVLEHSQHSDLMPDMEENGS